MRGASPLVRLLIAAAVALAVLTALLPSPPRAGQRLVVYCAAALRAPMEEIVAAYQDQTGDTVQLQYGGSNTLLSQIAVTRQGDLFLPADCTYADLARERGLAKRAVPVAQMTAVVAVAKGNPLGIKSLDDLKPLRVAIADPDLAAIGRTMREQLERAGRWDAFRKNVQVRGVTKPTVGDVANDVALGSVDAGIVWNAVAAQHPEIDSVRVPELEQGSAEITVATLTSSRDPRAAERFAAYLTDPNGGQTVFARHHFQPVESIRGISR